MKTGNWSCRPFHVRDYPTLVAWGEARGFKLVPLAMLPTHGLVVMHDERPVCAGFLYRTDSTLGVFENVLGNHALDSYTRGAGLDILINAVVTLATELGMQGLFSAFGQTSLVERAKKHGFEEAGANVTNLVRRL